MNMQKTFMALIPFFQSSLLLLHTWILVVQTLTLQVFFGKDAVDTTQLTICKILFFYSVSVATSVATEGTHCALS